MRRSEGDDTSTGIRYLFLQNYDNLKESSQQRLGALFSFRLETGKAWTYEEMLRDLWHHDTAREAKEFFRWWYRKVIHTRPEPMKKVTRTMKSRIDNIAATAPLPEYRTAWLRGSTARFNPSNAASVATDTGCTTGRLSFSTAAN
nr:transposase [Mariniblastus fucicola]